MNSQNTCWTLIDGAASGRPQDQESFARLYSAVIQAYLAARWRNTSYRNEIDDACQEVFIECFRDGGPLARADRSRPGGFRAFLYGITRNVAFRFERKMSKSPKAADADFNEVQADETSLSRAFDQAWAIALLRDAAKKHALAAKQIGPAAVRRVELLKLRFQEDKPIRDIAKLWNEDPTQLHREYAKARKEYEAILRDVVSFHLNSQSDKDVDQNCREILSLIESKS